MPTKYLYVDDEDATSLSAYTRAVTAETGEIEIEIEKPSTFDKEISRLIKILTNFNGLILDWRLDDIPSDGGYSSFRAGALAQELRTRATEGGIIDLPIVLWSTDTKLSGSFYEDNTSHDLFDLRYIKEDVVDRADSVRAELISVAEGYIRINETLSKNRVTWFELLGITKEEYDLLDRRFIALLSKPEKRAVHEYARFLLKEFVMRPGLLVSEHIIAARLGIDLENPGDWARLKEEFIYMAEYTGPFSKAWPRWWAQVIEKQWWRSFCKSPLSVLGAGERVKNLKEFTGLNNLQAATPIKESYGDHFQTVCIITGKPLDPVDGVIIDEKEPLPWQDRKYISLDSALERRGESKGIRPNPIEYERLKRVKQSRSRNVTPSGI